MRMKLAAAVAIGVLVWLASVSPVLPSGPMAWADGPSGGADPASGPLVGTFTFSYVGFQPYTQLTLAFLPPGASQFTIIDTPTPVITDGLGQAVITLTLYDLINNGSSDSPPDALALIRVANLVSVTWGHGPAGIASFRFDACDTVDCVDLVGATATQQPWTSLPLPGEVPRSLSTQMGVN